MSGVDKKIIAFSECKNKDDCGGKVYLQCVKINDKTRTVSKHESGEPGGICYPLSVAPLASAVETKLLDMQQNIKKNDGDKLSEWNNIITIASASVLGIGIIGLMIYMVRYIQKYKNKPETN